MRNEPNVPPPGPFGFIDDGTSIRISGMSGRGCGKECSNMIEKTYRYRHKYSSTALMIAEPSRSQVTYCGERNNKLILIKSCWKGSRFPSQKQTTEMVRINVYSSMKKFFFAINATLMSESKKNETCTNH